VLCAVALADPTTPLDVTRNTSADPRPCHLGYHTEITVLSVPATYASMKNRDIDVFLDNRMPSMEGPPL
jgi:glycine betaine/proline transport system substrate-binding protein